MSDPIPKATSADQASFMRAIAKQGIAQEVMDLIDRGVTDIRIQVSHDEVSILPSAFT